MRPGLATAQAFGPAARRAGRPRDGALPCARCGTACRLVPDPTGNVGAQDGHEFARNGNDADSAAGTVLEAPLFVAVSGVGPLLTDHGRGLVKFKTPPHPGDWACKSGRAV